MSHIPIGINTIEMEKEGLTIMDFMSKNYKRAYMSPICDRFYLEPLTMMVNSVQGSTDNKDVSEDPSDPWNTGQN
mgnify:CR=1 FL=1